MRARGTAPQASPVAGHSLPKDPLAKGRATQAKVQRKHDKFLRITTIIREKVLLGSVQYLRVRVCTSVFVPSS